MASMESKTKIQKLQKDLNDLERPMDRFFFRHFLLHERQ